MIKNISRLQQTFISIAVVLTLAACGGGGDGGTDTGAGTGGGADTGGGGTTNPAPADLQALVPSGYPANSPGEYMFNQLNAARTKCGFGAVRHDQRLDTSAQNHANYQARNGVFSHYENAADPGFTGVGARQRMIYASYNPFAEASFAGSNVDLFHAAEGISYSSTELLDGYKSHIPVQLSLVYHSIGTMRGYRDIGFGVSKRSLFNSGTGAFYVHNVASETASQKIEEGIVATYPCNGLNNIRTYHGKETPNPLGNRDLTANPPGHPVIVMSRWGSKLTDIQVVMQNAATGADVPMAAVRTMDNDTSGLMLRNEAFAIPDQQLEKSTSYRVKVTGKVDGKAFENNFTFTTGTLDKAAEQAGRYE